MYGYIIHITNIVHFIDYQTVLLFYTSNNLPALSFDYSLYLYQSYLYYCFDFYKV